MRKRSQDNQTDQVMDHSSDDARGTKRKPEDEGEREEAKRRDNMIMSSWSEEELTRRDTQEALRTRGRYYIGSVEESEDNNASMVMDVPSEEDYEQGLAEGWDDIDGQELDPEAVKKARAQEMEWCRKMNAYEKRPIVECFEKTKKPPIKVKWIDHNKGDRQSVNVRSRLVAKQINTGKEDGCLFAAAPPLEALRMLLSTTVTGNKSKSLMFNDICRVYMHARTTSDIYVELCDEDKTEPGDHHRCGKLIKSMCVARAAAHDWQAEVTRTMKDLGFKQGKASPCVFWHQQRDIRRSSTETTLCHPANE